ncbi:hypothetical protein Tco_0576466 [Tanacetum coccineum]
MCRICSWDEVVDKLIAHLSKWKMKTLSIGGRLTLPQWLGSLPIYHMSIFKVPKNVLHWMESIRSRFFNGIDLNSKKAIWVKWSKVLASKEKGGLGVSSFYALNRALMFKWVWRFKTQKDLLWSLDLLKALMGYNGRNVLHNPKEDWIVKGLVWLPKWRKRWSYLLDVFCRSGARTSTDGGFDRFLFGRQANDDSIGKPFFPPKLDGLWSAIKINIQLGRIVEQILKYHALSNALTTTTDVSVIYIQQFCKTVKQVPYANDTICFMLENKNIIYTLDMFPAALKLPITTVEKPFIPPANFSYIKEFLKILGYQGKLQRVSTFLVKNLAQPWQTIIKVFNRCLTSRMTGHNQTKINVMQIFHAVVNQKDQSIPKRLDEEYHTIKDDTLLVNMYTTGRQRKSTPAAPFPPSNDAARDDIIKATQLSLVEDKTAKLVEGDDESSGDEYADTMILSDEDSDDRIEPGSHKKNSEEIVDDNEKNDDDKHGDAKIDEGKDDDDDDHSDHSLIRNRRTGSSEIKIEKMQTLISSPPRSIRTGLSLDKSTVLNVHPNSCTSIASTSDLQQQLYLKMKLDLQSQVVDPQLWNVLKAKFEKYSPSINSCRYDAFRKHDHDDHPSDDAPQEGEKSAKRHKTSKSSKSTRGSSSK